MRRSLIQYTVGSRTVGTRLSAVIILGCGAALLWNPRSGSNVEVRVNQLVGQKGLLLVALGVLLFGVSWYVLERLYAAHLGDSEAERRRAPSLEQLPVPSYMGPIRPKA